MLNIIIKYLIIIKHIYLTVLIYSFTLKEININILYLIFTEI